MAGVSLAVAGRPLHRDLSIYKFGTASEILCWTSCPHYLHMDWFHRVSQCLGSVPMSKPIDAYEELIRSITAAYSVCTRPYAIQYLRRRVSSNVDEVHLRCSRAVLLQLLMSLTCVMLASSVRTVSNTARSPSELVSCLLLSLLQSLHVDCVRDVSSRICTLHARPISTRALTYLMHTRFLWQ